MSEKQESLGKCMWPSEDTQVLTQDWGWWRANRSTTAFRCQEPPKVVLNQHHSTQQVSKQLNLMNFINGPLPNKALGWWLLLRKVSRTSHSSNRNNTKSSFSTTLSPVKLKLYLKFGNSIDPRYRFGLQHLTQAFHSNHILQSPTKQWRAPSNVPVRMRPQDKLQSSMKYLWTSPALLAFCFSQTPWRNMKMEENSAKRTTNCPERQFAS